MTPYPLLGLSPCEERAAKAALDQLTLIHQSVSRLLACAYSPVHRRWLISQELLETFLEDGR